ncbi:MAG: hypothetical protein ACRDYX_23760 [Egibacteraceae bacterium]
MPTYARAARFVKDLEALSPDQRTTFKLVVAKFVADLKADRGFRPGLRVKGVQGADGVYEMTWAPDGRATFEYGDPVRAGEPHVVWRRVGTHRIFRAP